ncbi:amidohydrolase [Cochlodiniinecator piscidefendens]|uniref:amidohydrolase n=1 Tax=Cochlodiniinecator piscidefendens TaxID=2715756 RepID=UPI00140A0943|nr:amidohydrolase [Cochlodiniinecator piscidefendens]
MLSNTEISELIDLRRVLHQYPEVSGKETNTADRIVDALNSSGPDQIITGLGGAGVAAVFESGADGPTIMIRCELDALPIHEINNVDYISKVDGVAHLCGHDGHMAITIGVGRVLSRTKLKAGRVVLLFQPAEETGKGAASVLEDPKFSSISPDYAFSLHNVPGLQIGEVLLAGDNANCASRGMRIALSGKTSHASNPENGISPMQAMAELMPALSKLGKGGALDSAFRLVTITHCQMGAAAYGISPGAGEVWATLRTVTDQTMMALVSEAETLVSDIAKRENLGVEIGYDDMFHNCTNHPEAVSILKEATHQAEVNLTLTDQPMRWSEDFGLFGQSGAKAAMLFLGSGLKQPQLHNPDFDFPEELIPVGVSIFVNAINNVLENF